jgi:hypothetical protein
MVNIIIFCLWLSNNFQIKMNLISGSVFQGSYFLNIDC